MILLLLLPLFHCCSSIITYTKSHIGSAYLRAATLAAAREHTSCLIAFFSLL